VTNGSSTDNPNNKGRSRGIRASQPKLRTALLSAGFKSQADVVEKIQALENLDKAPRSLVSRVFRGESVDPLSIERVANALNVEAWSLYLDSAELQKFSTARAPQQSSESAQIAGTDDKVEHELLIEEDNKYNDEDELRYSTYGNDLPTPANSPQEPSSEEISASSAVPTSTEPTISSTEVNTTATMDNKAVKSGKPLLLSVLLILLGLSIVERFWPLEHNTKDKTRLTDIVDIDNKVVAVIPIKGVRGADITRNIELLLAGPTQLIVGSSALYAGISNPHDLLRSKKADLVISGELKEIGRYIGVRLFLSQDQNMRQVWSGIFAKSTSDQFIKSKLKGVLQKLLSKRPIRDIADWYSLQRFLRGLQYFEGERTEEVILRAMADFQGVISNAPELVFGYAGMCLALIEQSLDTSNKSFLQDAEQYCNTGAQKDPDSPFIQTAFGNLARVRGDYEQANIHFYQALETDPNNVTAIQKLAESEMRIFLKERDPALFEQLTSRLDTAAKLEPSNWKVPYTQGRAYYFKGDQLSAIHYFSQAAALSNNYQTLNNLGALEFCVGDLENAKQHYQQALILRPNHSVLRSNIAVLHFYLGENQQALDIFEPQIKYIQENGGPGLYQLWSNVADVYRTQGKHEKALNAYHNAMSELDREMSQGEANVMQKASRLAMYILVTEMSPDTQTEQLLTSLREQADALNNVQDPVSLHQLALSWLHLGDKQKANYFRSKLHAICPGFAASPDFKALEQEQIAAEL
jgi:tetratricopeptide (TPR) repeat protein